MHIVLTHDNSDFDAVAAQLAVTKLDPAAIPILSRRLNRNVQNFLTLYGAGLPFIYPDQWARKHVEQVTVVDSQTYSSVKGMRPNTPVQIIDHHPLAKDLEDHQRYSGETLGATTTLLVEQLRSRSIMLIPIEASLLMLGIYEDTGSLLYGTTTSRDLIAAAWLLEQGASLDIVRSFLRHPLSDDQQMLYDKLLQGVQTYEVSGYVVLVASAQIDHTVDEVSTLAHTIREVYEAQAIILLVAMDDYVQLVARSTVDQIDVGTLATKFGGGGHGRAAAAVSRDLSLQQVQARLLDLLPVLVRPSVHVADLMSRSIHTVAGDDLAGSVAIRMQRSGHEGYPVLENGKVIGLLTRRAVDRAMSHNLAQTPIRQIMENGSTTVRAEDSIETLQQIMMQSGWGQIPVVDNEGNLLGIVTRTDLIKQLGQGQESRQDEAGRKMQDALPAGLLALLEAIAKEAEFQQVGLYVVGGFVRDLLLGLPNLDIDLVVEGDAIILAKAVANHYGGEIKPHQQFGTAKWYPDSRTAEVIGVNQHDWPEFIDFVSARREFYEAPAALPIVEQGSIKLDLHRRDFTINTLAIRLAPAPFGKLLDFWGGERDLRLGIIRALHSLSFIDDATRLLRAVRFEQRLDFEIEPNTLMLFPGALPFIQRLSGERIRHELDLILEETQPEKALSRAHELGVLGTIDQRLVFDEWLRSAFIAARDWMADPTWKADINLHLPDVYWVILTARLNELNTLAERLQLPRSLTDQLLHGHRAYMLMPVLRKDLRPSDVVESLESLTDTALVAAWAIAPTQAARDKITRYAHEWRHMSPTITGSDLKAKGLKPGPLFGKLLSELRRAWLDGQITTAMQERAYLDQLLAEERNS